MNDSILEKAQRAGDAIAEAAEEIRKLTDVELVQLFAVARKVSSTAISSPRTSTSARAKPAKVAVPKAKARPAKPSRPAPAAVPAPRPASLLGRVLACVTVKPITTEAIASKLGETDRNKVATALSNLGRRGDVARVAAKTWSLPPSGKPARTGRQTRKKPSKPARAAADEEEGAPALEDESVKLTLFAPMRPPPPAPARRASPVIPCDPKPALELVPPPPVPVQRPARSEQSGVHVLPVLEAGEGERRDDCHSYGECLKRYVKALPKHNGSYSRGEGPARCPPTCAHYAVTPLHDRVARAHELARPAF